MPANDVEAWLDEVETDDSIEAGDVRDLREIGGALIGPQIETVTLC